MRALAPEFDPWQSTGGLSTRDWLAGFETTLPPGVELVSSEGVKKETVPGAFSVVRNVSVDGVKGRSILYAFIAPSYEKSGKGLARVYINGEHFWNRDD